MLSQSHGGSDPPHPPLSDDLVQHVWTVTQLSVEYNCLVLFHQIGFLVELVN
jgi:hypothetical protein